MKFSFVTPSYFRDHERCLLLCDSIEKYAPKDAEHYVIVSQADEELFRKTLPNRTHLLIQEQMVPGNFWKIPFLKTWRFSFSTLPIRGWIWQQLVKLSLPNSIASEAYLMLDSDTFLTRTFDPSSLIQNDSVPFFVEEKDFYLTHRDTQSWAKVSRSILGISPLEGPSSKGYVSCYAYWRRDNLLKLQEHVLKHTKKDTLAKALANHKTFSEYALYGTFVDEILKRENSGHYVFEQDIVHAYWQEKQLSKTDIQGLKNTQSNTTFLTMINSKSRTPVDLIRSVYGFEK